MTVEKLTIFLTTLSLFAASCQSEPQEEESAQPTELQTIEGGDAQVSSPKSLCELVEYAEVVGHYHVDRIVSNMGPSLDDPDDTAPAPYTVVSLDGPSWIGPADPEIKMAGGVLPDGRGTIATELPFTVGHEVIAFLGAPHYDDGTRKPLIQSVLYPTEAGGFASDFLMGRDTYTADDVEQLVRAASDGTCDTDVLPNSVIDKIEAENRSPPEPEDEHPVVPEGPDMGPQTDSG